MGWNQSETLIWFSFLMSLQILFMFVWYVFLRLYDLRATLLLGQFMNVLALLLCYFLTRFKYFLLGTSVIQAMTLTLASILPFYFSVRWFRSEMRFLFTSLLLFAALTFPFELIILAVSKIADTSTLDLRLYEEALVIKGIICFIFLGILILCFHDTKHYPSAMSSRALDPLKKGLRLAFSSLKLVRIIMAFTLNFCPLVMIYRTNISLFESYYVLLASCLSIILLLLFFKRLRLQISSSFKVSLVVSSVLNVLLLFLVEKVP